MRYMCLREDCVYNKDKSCASKVTLTISTDYCSGFEKKDKKDNDSK